MIGIINPKYTTVFAECVRATVPFIYVSINPISSHSLRTVCYEKLQSYALNVNMAAKCNNTNTNTHTHTYAHTTPAYWRWSGVPLCACVCLWKCKFACLLLLATLLSLFFFLSLLLLLLLTLPSTENNKSEQKCNSNELLQMENYEKATREITIFRKTLRTHKLFYKTGIKYKCELFI